MIGNITPAGGPTNVVNSEQQALQLFGPSSNSQTSAQFTVDQHPFTLSAYNLGADDVILVQQVVGQGSGLIASTYQPVYGPAQLDTHRSKLVIEHPGRYQLHHTGSSGLGTFTVLGGAYSSSSSGIAELAAGLQAVITQVGTTVTGVAPIVVTPSGFNYAVSLPDVVIAPFITSVGLGIDPSGFSHVAAFGSNVGAGSVLSNCTGFGIDSMISAGIGPVTFNFTVAGGAASYEQSGGTVTISNGTAFGFSAALACAVAGTFYGCKAGNGNTFANAIVINNASGNALNATQANQAVIGDATITQLKTAGSIIQGGVISASDERLKAHLEAEWQALEQLEKLSPVTFDWSREAVAAAKINLNEDEFNKRQHGFIAQEVEEVFPELVENIDSGSGPYLFVRYERFISVLVAAIQELSAKVKALENGK